MSLSGFLRRWSIDLWIVLIILIILVILLIISLSGRPKEVSLENKTCSEMVDIYNECKPLDKRDIYCYQWYADKIIECYGDALQDQLALINQSG